MWQWPFAAESNAVQWESTCILWNAGGRSLKVMVIHHGDEAGNALAERVRSLGAEVVEQEPKWPDFFYAVHIPFTPGQYHRDAAEQPKVIIVECSTDPSVGRECGGYFGETAFTRQIPVYLVDHPEDESYKARRRAPNAKLVTSGQLDRAISELLEAAK